VEYLEKLRRSRWKDATDAKSAAMVAKIARAVQLREEGLSHGQIAARLTAEREDGRWPPSAR
jgi:hypothetical protein